MQLDRVLRLRWALGCAGIVTGYKHVCRKRGCGYVKEFADADLRRCPTRKHRLRPLSQPRRVRLHDLRPTTATLLLKAGVPPHTMQRILRHTDPVITSEIYGHLPWRT